MLASPRPFAYATQRVENTSYTCNDLPELTCDEGLPSLAKLGDAQKASVDTTEMMDSKAARKAEFIVDVAVNDGRECPVVNNFAVWSSRGGGLPMPIDQPGVL